MRVDYYGNLSPNVAAWKILRSHGWYRDEFATAYKAAHNERFRR